MSKRIEKTRISIAGMNCMRCAFEVEQALNRKSGVVEASVNLTRSEVIIEYDSNEVEFEELREVIIDTGYIPLTPQKGSD